MTDIRSNDKNIGRFSIVTALFCFVLLLISSNRATAEAEVAVLYPEIREPFRSVFMNIIKGIDDALDDNVDTRALKDSDTPADILAWARERGLKSIITLGNHGFSMSSELSREMPVVIGAVNMSSDLLGKSYYGISLNPDSASLFQRLKALAPKVTRIIVVYQRQQDSWMIEQATKAAQILGIELQAVAVENLQEAANKYREILNNQHSDTDALWLPQDSAVLDEQAILPMILKEAWDRRLIVFSSNPAFVKRGVLFALYPDNYNMGRSLGAMASRLQAAEHRGEPSARHIEPLRDLLIAFNVRTAAHLDIRYTRDDLNDFDLVFPSR
ncbi:MAG: ABC transporter substrate-binding protein [Gammaproteobacteria bacterium]|nr:ABC transporter substrate-binding protein [Gammaproteobacteria bacterium]